MITLSGKILTGLLGILSMGLIGCSSTSSIENQAEKLLEEKYKETFVIEDNRGRQMGEDYYTLICYPESQPNILFKARIFPKENTVEDNFVSKCVFRKISKEIEENLKGLAGSFFVYSEPVAESMKLDNPDISVDEYLSMYPNEIIGVNLYFAPQKLDNDIFYDSLSEAFNGLNLDGGNIYIYIMDETHMNKVHDYLDSVDTPYDEHKGLTKPFYKGYIKIRDGKIQCSKEEFVEMMEENT